MPITKELIKALRVDLDAVVVEIGKKHNVSIKTGRFTFDPMTATLKLEVATIGTDGEVISKEMAHLQQFLPSLGLKPEHLTQTFRVGQTLFILAGFRNTGGAKPFIVKSLVDGKLYMLSRTQVRRGLGLPEDELDRLDRL